MRAYDESYLDDAMANLGDAFAYAALDCRVDLDDFSRWFVASGCARKFGSGNPRYVAGMSGVELARVVLRSVGLEDRCAPRTLRPGHDVEYWCGWILAYYQWHSGLRFDELFDGGLTAGTIARRYILHEADTSAFVAVADEILRRSRSTRQTRLQTLRKAAGLTQRALADKTGVSLRMIQLYEQRQNDINRAEAVTVVRLARVLNCDVDDLLELSGAGSSVDRNPRLHAKTQAGGQECPTACR